MTKQTLIFTAFIAHAIGYWAGVSTMPVQAEPLPQIEVIEVVEKPKYETKAEIAKYIWEQAEANGINPELFLRVANCESQLNPKAHGDKHIGNSYGLWQIHQPSHPEVTYEQATDVEWSTQYAVKLFKQRPTAWTCYRLIQAGKR